MGHHFKPVQEGDIRCNYVMLEEPHSGISFLRRNTRGLLSSFCFWPCENTRNRWSGTEAWFEIFPVEFRDINGCWLYYPVLNTSSPFFFFVEVHGLLTEYLIESRIQSWQVAPGWREHSSSGCCHYLSDFKIFDIVVNSNIYIPKGSQWHDSVTAWLWASTPQPIPESVQWDGCSDCLHFTGRNLKWEELSSMASVFPLVMRKGLIS